MMMTTMLMMMMIIIMMMIIVMMIMMITRITNFRVCLEPPSSISKKAEKHSLLWGNQAFYTAEVTLNP